MKIFNFIKNLILLKSGSSSNYADEFDITKGIFIKEITFLVKANKEDLDTFPNGVVPWISLDTPENELLRLKKNKEVVLDYKSLYVVIDYPLKKPKVFEINAISNSGFSRSDLITEISKIYQIIYQEEEDSSSVKTIPMNERGNFINRNETNGKYGIWGHDLRDLDLSSVYVVEKSNGKIYLHLNIES